MAIKEGKAKKNESIINSYTPFININAGADVTSRLMSRIAMAGMDNYTFDLLSEYVTSCKWYQLPPLNPRVEPSKTCVRLGNGLFNLSKALQRRDIEEDHQQKLKIGPKDGSPMNDNQFRNLCDRIHKGIIYNLVANLGMHHDDEGYVKYDARAYLPGMGIGGHSDADNKDGDELYYMRLVAGIGPGRKITHSLKEYDLINPDNGTLLKGVFGGENSYTVTTDDVASAYLMPPDISGKKYFCYTNVDKTKMARALHEVAPLEPSCKECGAILVIDFVLRSEEAVLKALEYMRNNVFSLLIPLGKSEEGLM